MANPTYTLYYNPYSINSLAVQYAWALRGNPKGAEISIKLSPVDIFNFGQFEEEFLCRINDLGQVPVLKPPPKQGGTGMIPDSVDITIFLAAKYPDLLPPAHADRIIQLLETLHGINFFSITFSGRPQGARRNLAEIDRRLASSEISPEYREALEFKRQLVQSTRLDAVEPAEVEWQENKTVELLNMLANMASPAEEKQWLFGDKATALDTHLVVFLARLMDIGKTHLIPAELQGYASRAMKGSEWTTMMDGRTTLP